jgi:hypothetical protein
MKAKNTQGIRTAERFRFPLKRKGYGMALTFAGISLMASIGELTAVTTQPILETSPEYEAVAEPLRSAPRKSFDFQKGSLTDILRFLADESGISFIALPESSGENANNGQLITFSINASPFSALETIARTHGVALVYDEGIFHMRPIDDKQLIARTYQILHNASETANTTGGSSSSASSSFGGGGSSSSGGGSSSGLGSGSSSSGGTGGGLGGIGIGSATQFTTNADKLVEDILSLLNLGTTGFDANIASMGSVGNFSPLMVDANGTVVNNETTQQATSSTSSGTGHAIWNSDTNSLFVVATRQQHQYVESYLEMIDKPQPLIAVEVKFFETTKDPSRQIGVDWTGTMDGGYNLDLVNAIQDETTGIVTETANNALSSVLNLDRFAQGWVAPQTAILSGAALNLKVQALLKDRETTTVSYPRVLTKNNRQVSIESVVNQPVLAATSSTTPGVGGTSTASVEYVPIGTSIQVLPKHMSDGRINMQVLITISSIVGYETIDTNRYPVASSRVFTAPLEVESGYTLAIGGLEEATDATDGTGLPLLGRLPLLKRVFGSKSQTQSRKNLMIFITPTILNPRSGGIPEKPISEVPLRGNSRLAEPRVHEDGTLIGGLAGFKHALAWLEEEEALVNNIVRETRGGDEDTREHITNLIRTTEILQKQAKDLKSMQPDDTEELDSIIWALKSIEEKFRNSRWDARKKNIHLFSESKTEPF